MRQELIGDAMATVAYKFTRDKFRKDLMKRKKLYEEQQTARLLAYAQEQVMLMGDEIKQIITSQDGSTGNLLDSICWGVWHNKKSVGKGYYNKEITATEYSYLHEFNPSIRESVSGRYLAQQFLEQYQANIVTDKGWQMVWGVLAPYYAYWEAGHTNILRGGQFVQFTAMSQRYDHIRQALEPKCRVHFEVTVPTY